MVDASGSIDEDGKISQPGSGNPVQDVMDIEIEIELWISHIIDRNRPNIIRDAVNTSFEEELSKSLTGIKTKPWHIIKALMEAELSEKPFPDWTPEDTLEFSHKLLPIIKPTLIMANKMDLATAEENLEKLIDYHSHSLVAACSAEAELALRRADKSGLIRYSPGQETFQVVDEDRLTLDQKKAIQYIEEKVMYPVSNEAKYSDGDGNILPDVHLMENDDQPIDLAKTVHSRLAENFILAIDARTGLRLPKEYTLRHRDIVKIMTQKRSQGKSS